MRVLERSRDLVGDLLQVLNLRRAESILGHAARIQRSPHAIARNQGHAANRPDPAFIHGPGQGFVPAAQVVRGEEGNVSGLDGPRRERLLERRLCFRD